MKYRVYFLLIFVAVALISQNLFAQTDAELTKLKANQNKYICPPCGHNCLQTIFDKSGGCGDCGMQLVQIKTFLENINRPDSHTQPDTERKSVAILIFDGVQIIDFTAPYEVFQSTFNVFTVAKTTNSINTVGDMSVNPDYSFENCPAADVLLIPGGQVFETQNDSEVLGWLQRSSENADHVVSVCNGAFILAKAGLLNGLSATTTRNLVSGLVNAAPNINVVRNTRFVDNGKVITSGGLSAGIDASLHVVAKERGEAFAEMVARNLEYDWRKNEGTIISYD